MTTIEIILAVLVFVGTFLFMEGVAWFTHKYIMHGFLWIWHESHHKLHNHLLERNDLFPLVFSVPSFKRLVYLRASLRNSSLLDDVLERLFNGIFYFIFHDVIVHQRIKWRPKKRSKYLNRMINAHYIHHKVHTKEGAQAFGFLYAPKKFEEKKP